MKNVVGYDLTQLLVGSEGTLAILTKIILRLIPKPPAPATLRATFPTRRARGRCGRRGSCARAWFRRRSSSSTAIRSRPSHAISACDRSRRPGTAALLLIEVDGLAEQVRGRSRARRAACREAGATEVLRARRRGRARRSSGACAARSRRRCKHDRAAQVQPRRRRAEGAHPGAVRARRAISRRVSSCAIPCFGHVGDGNIHVNIMVTPRRCGRDSRARTRPKRVLFGGVVALEGSISGEHGIGFAKAPYLGLRADAGDDRAHEARQARVRSARHPESRQDLSDE